jgi:hypothetical protein
MDKMTVNWPDFYDAELARHHRHFMAAADVGRRDRVLDIGCGADKRRVRPPESP